MKERIYQCVILANLIFFLLFFRKNHENYMDLLDANDQMTNLLKEQKISSDELLQYWKQSYGKLQSSYGELLAENDKLESQLRRIELPVYDFTEAEIYLIAQCVEAEAGYYKGHELSQQYVTQVILNRLHSSKFPDSVEGVIYQKKNGCPQFSVAYNGAMDDREVQPDTLANVYSVIVNGTDLPRYVCYFYSAKVKENWVNTLPIYDVVDGTVFAYKHKEDY